MERLDLSRSIWDQIEDEPESPDDVPPWPVLPTLAESFPQQWAYETSEAKFNAVACSRRAGKSYGAVRRHTRTLLTARPGSWCHAGSLIRRNARKHFWNPVKAQLDRLGVGYHADEREMILQTERGTWFQAFGCDDERDTKAVQGDGSVLFTIDECHLPNDDILKMLVDVATPMLTDTGGTLDLLGLPPQTDGFFRRSLDGVGEDGEPVPDGLRFRAFGWCMFDHDFPRKREDKLADVLERCAGRGLKIELVTTEGADGRPVITCGPATHPIAAWTYFGKRVVDPATLAYEFQRGRNEYDPDTVDFTKGDWRTGWGFDMGYSDHDALVVCSYNVDDPKRRIYVRWFWRHRHLDAFDDADVVRVVREVFSASRIVGDNGGHGSVKVLKGMERVLRLVIQPKPKDVMVSLGDVNDDFRTGRLLVPTRDVVTPLLLEAAERLYEGDPERLEAVRGMLLNTPTKDVPKNSPADLATELGQVIKTVNPRTKKFEINKRGKHSDLTEALRYCHSGLLRAPGEPAEPVVTDPEAVYEAKIQAQIANHERNKGRRRWA